MRIDHVIYATADLDGAAARIETDLGLPAVGGGRHEGLGTHNRIVPLGEGYLELLAIADAEEAAASDLRRAVRQRGAHGGEGRAGGGAGGGGALGGAGGVEGVAPHAARVGIEQTTIARQGMSAQLAGLAES